MLFGTYEHVLDNKNRLMLPSKLRSNLDEYVYIMKGFDGCVSLFSSDSYNMMVSKLEEMSFNHSKERSYIRILLASTVEIKIDNLGRIQIPSLIVEKYGLNKNLTVIGAGDHIELWNTSDWNEYINLNEKQFDETAEVI